MSETINWYTARNIREEVKKDTSPSGEYHLVIYKYKTDPGYGDVSLGKIYKKGSDTPLFEVRRNFYSFPYSWVEGHPNGHDYLITGEDYQGQTVLELDTGNRRDYLPEAAKKGHGFCWAGHAFNYKHQILVVEGCFWAAPYESKFFDFSDPMSGWSEIVMDSYIDCYGQEPVFNEDGTLTCYQSEDADYDEDGDQDEEKTKYKASAIAASKTFSREGLKLVLINEWVADKEQIKRNVREENQRKYDEGFKTFRDADPLYLAMIEGLKDPIFNPDAYDSVGQTYEAWCPWFTPLETRLCRRILNRKYTYTVDLEWGCITGPVKLVIYKNGKHLEDKFFMEHSVTSINAAFEYTKRLCEDNC